MFDNEVLYLMKRLFKRSAKADVQTIFHLFSEARFSALKICAIATRIKNAHNIIKEQIGVSHAPKSIL
ncbi:MAG: hypothetical protein CL599_16050 [Alteromonas sp.]|nr:hypothetical protein [Alteromonas sp.]OUX84625.1 MAG: hypothetical protein CBB95_15690 [Alteromonas sp. TMED35]